MTDTAALLAEGVKRLAAAGIDSPRAEARILLAHVSPRPEIPSATRPQFPTSPQGGGEDLAERFFALIERREKLEPVAYITGLREFWSLEFDVGPGVLIPRPETETLVEEAIKTFADQKATLEVLDLGTGTACLPIAFLKEYPKARAVAVDASPAALAWAKRNVEKHGLQQRCALREGQWTDGLTGAFDVIFSNPPYIDTPTVGTLEADVRAFEPHTALDGGTDGLDAYRALAPRIASHLKQTGRTFVELGAGQADSVRGIFVAAGLETIRVVPDLSGIARCLVAAKRP